MTPLERAARAIFDLDQQQAGAGPSRWEQQFEAFREHKRNQVRAVLTAIREPSEVMVKAGNRTKPYNVTGYCEGTIHPVVQRAWPAMIDAMLAEEG